MKKLLLLLFITSFIGCSESNEDKAKKLVKTYLKETLNNPKSYEIVSWGNLDSIFTSIEKDPIYSTYIHYINIQESYIEMLNKPGDKEKREENIEKLKELKSDVEKLRSTFNYEFLGWRIPHKYRATNEFGAVVLIEDTFYIDKDFKEVK